MIASRVSLRPICPDDVPFLRQVYASTRLDELASSGWSAAQVDAFLKQQFDAQQHHYQTHYDGATFSVILLGDHGIGRLYVARWPDEIRLVDIALLPQYRGAGIGSTLIRSLLSEAEQCGKPVRVHAEKGGRAVRLYERLGFSTVDDRGVYWFMEWVPGRSVRQVSSRS